MIKLIMCLLVIYIKLLRVFVMSSVKVSDFILSANKNKTNKQIRSNKQKLLLIKLVDNNGKYYNHIHLKKSI